MICIYITFLQGVRWGGGYSNLNLVNRIFSNFILRDIIGSYITLGGWGPMDRFYYLYFHMFSKIYINKIEIKSGASS